MIALIPSKHLEQYFHPPTASLRHRLFLYSLYLPLQHFQDEVDRTGVHFNRQQFGKLQRYTLQYQLPCYRALHEKQQQQQQTSSEAQQTNSLPSFTVQHYPAHLKWAQLFLLLYSLRCALALVGQRLHASREVKIWLGDELTGSDGFELETTFLLWGVVCVLFLHFTLTSNLLDYQFMALFSMTGDSKSSPSNRKLHYSAFNLTDASFRQFRLFRTASFAYFHLIHCSLTPTSYAAVITLTWLAGLYGSHPFPSFLFTAFHLYYMYLIIAIIYFALVAFVLIAYYIHVKQRQLTDHLLNSLNSQKPNLYHLLEGARSLNQLSEEISTYNHFWSSYLSLVFLFYVLLIVFITFVCLFARMTLVVNVGYWLVLLFHVASVGAIVHLAGLVVLKNEQTSVAVLSFVGKLAKQSSKEGTPFYHHLKLHLLAQNLQTVEDTGFTLLNGYLIRHDTFRLLGVNIVVYFILILGNYSTHLSNK